MSAFFLFILLTAAGTRAMAQCSFSAFVDACETLSKESAYLAKTAYLREFLAPFVARCGVGSISRLTSKCSKQTDQVVDLLKLFLCGEEDAIYRIKDRQFANVFALLLDRPAAALQQEAARSGDLSAALSQVCLFTVSSSFCRECMR
jgi:hypothetical protein